MRKPALAALICTLAAPAWAEDCRSDGGPLTSLPKGEVIAPKAHFIRATCADDPAADGCTRKAYLVQGDLVFLGPTLGLLQCVGYLGRGGSYTEGWLPLAAIAPY